MEMTMPAVTKIREDQTAPKKERMLIGGELVDSTLGEWLEVEDPAHRRPIAEVPRGRSEDVARAMKAAADAFPAWSRRCSSRGIERPCSPGRGRLRVQVLPVSPSKNNRGPHDCIAFKPT
jgi:hypothetical protein